jgi:hypothetical protein
MNKELWDKIEQFDFDNPPTEYGFSTRLANENFWTKEFTENAILEYKKFMYLAATSDHMVSPSEIVDTVWHQHLIFTQLYQDFCSLVGKEIQHIPSTHNKNEFHKFKLAKERTTKLYENAFGKQPVAIWNYNNMYESLNLDKAKLKIRTFVIIGMLSFIVVAAPAYFLLRPIYVRIDNPYFLFALIGFTFVIYMCLEVYNRKRLKRIVSEFDKQSLIYNLQPYELVYLKTQKLSNVIKGVVNELIENSTIKVNSDNTLELVKTGEIKSIEQLQTIAVLNDLGKTFYPILSRQLAAKPIFWNVSNCMDAFKKYFNKSQKFGRLFYFNFGVLCFPLLLGLIRLTTGILRDKPVALMTILVIALSVLMIFYLIRLTKLVCTKTIPDIYKREILPTRQIEGNWQWSFFLFGSAALTSSFIPLVNYTERSGTSGTSCGTSCGSSCGSSCSSCGGCGGD